ncbi:MAG: hypothetical protein ABQ298_04065 [Puniceicoccaceae bacterium]
MLVVSAGLFRSGSTWLYNAARHLLQAQLGPDVLSGWIEDVDRKELLSAKHALVKIHEFDEEIAGNAQFILVSHRDLRDMMTSLHRKFAADLTVERVHTVLRDYDRWEQRATLVLRYEEILMANTRVLSRIADSLKLDPFSERELEQILVEMEREAATSKPERGRRSNRLTGLHQNHRIDGRMGQWREWLPAGFVREIEVEFADWMKRHEYAMTKPGEVVGVADEIWNKIRQFEGAAKRVVIFGTGRSAERAWDVLLNYPGFCVKAFADNDPEKSGTMFRNLPVWSPNELLRNCDWDIVCIASQWQQEIAAQLRQMGLEPEQIAVNDPLGRPSLLLGIRDWPEFGSTRMEIPSKIVGEP